MLADWPIDERGRLFSIDTVIPAYAGMTVLVCVTGIKVV